MTATDPAAPPEAGAPDPDAAQRAIEYCYERGWSDGLPLMPVSQPLLDRFLATTRRGPEEVVARLEQVDAECTVRLAAINAAMAGCAPEHFPVVLAVLDALMRDRAARGGAWQSTSGPAPMIVVNGAARARLGFNSAGGVFGPGYRANATVPRAVGLIVRNAFGVRPGLLEQATQGLPGRWAVCLGENEEESPWPPLSADAEAAGGGPGGPGGSAGSVSVMLLRTCEFVDNRHTDDVERLLWDFADTISRTGSLIFRDTSCGVVFCPEHAQALAAAGYGKGDVRDWLLEHCGRTRADLRRVGKNGLSDHGVRFDDAADAGDPRAFTPIIPSPVHLPIVVAGARNAGISMVVRVFGLWSGVTVPIEAPA